MKEDRDDKMPPIEAEYRVIEEDKDAREPLTPGAKSSVPGFIIAILLGAIVAVAGVAYYVIRSGSHPHTDEASTVQSATQQSAQSQTDQSQTGQQQGSQQSQTQTPTVPMNAGVPVRFWGGKFEASGVVHLPGTDTVVFVDDDRPSEVFLMRINDTGQQVGAVRSIFLGAGIEDPEGITFDGTYFYIVGSQAKPRKGPSNAIARFTMDQNSSAVSNLAIIPNFRSLLLSRVAELRGVGELEGDDGGLNV
ncbi:MAG TPA: hypothetical protein VID27_22980, partial [Blastocatellia bacterium]